MPTQRDALTAKYGGRNHGCLAAKHGGMSGSSDPDVFHRHRKYKNTEYSAPAGTEPAARDCSAAINPEHPSRRGRKPAGESRAAEIRIKLLAWKQTPEPHKITVRALAREIGTSHQLLACYLKGLKEWQAKDYQRRAKAVRERAWAENRGTTAAEEQQAVALDRAGLRLMLESALDSAYKRYEKEFREMQPGALTGAKLRLIKTLARQGVPFAQKLLQEHQTNLPVVHAHVAKSFRSA